ncbi:hypothetical protein CBM2608_A50043 [Cupriavidus taiwanensis]|nr:hypothetical protein CBM2608_A50043 [Cupriavidus taiwanensis]
MRTDEFRLEWQVQLKQPHHSCVHRIGHFLLSLSLPLFENLNSLL